MENNGVSEVLYTGLCYEIGTPEDVSVRREVLDVSEMIEKPVQILKGMRTTTGGSYREGFRFKSSDRDYMSWRCDHKVLCDMSQYAIYHSSKDTLILMDTSNTPGGYARLQLLTPSRNPIVNSSLSRINDVNYISSSLFRGWWHHHLQGTDPARKTEVLHGPCYSFSFSLIETDLANCLHCSEWPSAALNSINRYSVLQEFLSEGCHLVPIESKLPNDFEDLEWRISFALAERKLVYNMDHVQFLCYGLLKIFLKETICDELLSSYFMKSLVFWKLMDNYSMPWAPYDLLQYFWTCFKFLIHSVHTGCLPNFFIPENNMFLGKVTGPQQMSLFEKLEKIYNVGVTCLLQSPSLRKILIPTLSALYLERHVKSELEKDIALQKEMKKSKLDFKCRNLQEMKIYLETTTNLSIFNHSANFQKAKTEVLTSIGMSLKSKCLFRNKNKLFYQSHKLVSYILTVVSKIGFASDILYLALYLYDIGQYPKASIVLEKARQRLSRPHVMYNGEVDEQTYCKLVAGLSLSSKMKNAWARNVKLYSHFTYIDELKLEQWASQKNGVDILHLPPLVLTHMLSVLCLHRLGDKPRCQQSLTDLRTLLHTDDEKNIPKTLRDISWQMLGICQHDIGDLHGALHSYQQALKQCQQLDEMMNVGFLTAVMGNSLEPRMLQLLTSIRDIKIFKRVQEATEMRINSLQQRMSI
ncbi:uncharacterized protein LOC134263044 [Saccostrea cucullata]|uniref:uncharacterized protein LOC134263044 n=1 Tax=Saccostrea cuccullata TaxID=36930 RepID=UPI002ED297CB